VGLIAQIETVSTMPSAILERIRANRDRQRLECGGLTSGKRLASEHTRDVGFDWEHNNFVGAAFENTNANGVAGREPLPEGDRITQATDNQKSQEDELSKEAPRLRW